MSAQTLCGWSSLTVPPASPAYFYNEKVMCALGAGLSETGTLSPEGPRPRAVSRSDASKLWPRAWNLPPLTAVATAAVREATDGPDFCAEVLRETGLKIWVIDGQEEARSVSPRCSARLARIIRFGLRHRRLVNGARRSRPRARRTQAHLPLGPLKLQRGQRRQEGPKALRQISHR